MNRKVKRNIINIALIIFLTALAIMFIYPLVYMLMNSMKTEVQYYTNPFSLPTELSIHNYISLFSKFGVFKYMKNTLIVAVTSITINLTLGVFAAYGFAKMDFRGKSTSYLVIIFSMFFPAQVTLIPLYVMFAKMGLMNSYFGMALVTSAALLPGTIMLLRSNFVGMEKALFEAAKLDGAGYFQVVRHILLPIARPAIAISTIFNVLTVCNDLLRPMILLQDQEKRTLSVALAALMNNDNNDPTYVFAGLFISALIPLIVYLVFSKYIVKGVTVGSVK